MGSVGAKGNSAVLLAKAIVWKEKYLAATKQNIASYCVYQQNNVVKYQPECPQEHDFIGYWTHDVMSIRVQT